MSRVANSPVSVPSGVEVNIASGAISIKGAKGVLTHNIAQGVEVTKHENQLKFVPLEGYENADALAGTTRALVNNMVTGVSRGFEKKLQLVGVGYRAQAQGKVLNLTLGFSHPVNFPVPEGITIETPSQTEIVVKGVNKQQVGQIAANIRSIRPPEPYKGKGVRYSDEQIVRKEAKKK
jgi:large subunit ribosomal protein L6